jgi:kinesin family member C2/C3
MPLPIAKALAAATPPPLDKITEHLSPPKCSPPVVSNDKASRSKRISNILRRSLQKKVVVWPAMVAQMGKKASTTAHTGGATLWLGGANAPPHMQEILYKIVINSNK